MSVTPAAAFGLKADDPDVLRLKQIPVVKLPIWNPMPHRARETMKLNPMVFAGNPRRRSLGAIRLRWRE